MATPLSAPMQQAGQPAQTSSPATMPTTDSSTSFKPQDSMQSLQSDRSSSCCVSWCWNRVCDFFSAVGRLICNLFGRNSTKPSTASSQSGSSQASTSTAESATPPTPNKTQKSAKERSLLLPVLKPANWTKEALTECEKQYGLPHAKGQSGYYNRFQAWECHDIIKNYKTFNKCSSSAEDQIIQLEFLHALTDVNRAGEDADLAQSILKIDKKILQKFTSFLSYDIPFVSYSYVISHDHNALQAALKEEEPVAAVHKFADRLLLAEQRAASARSEALGRSIRILNPRAKEPVIQDWVHKRIANYVAQFAGQSVQYNYDSLKDPTYGCLTDFSDYTPKEQLGFIYVLTQPKRAEPDQAHKDSILTMSKEALSLFIDAMKIAEPIAFNKQLLLNALEQDNPATAVHQFVGELLLAYTKKAEVPKAMRPADATR